MIQGVPSKTAYRVAMRRAAHQVLDAPLVLDDPVALRIIGAASAEKLRANPAEYDAPGFARYMRAFLVARSRFAEDELAVAVGRGVRQYVVLGAGLDTFAYRNPHEAAHLRVFEVDHPATQQWKRERLETGGIAIPSSVTHVPVDFETQNLGAELAKAGLRQGAPVFFAWLGVVPYLTLASVMATFRYIAEVAGTGGGVVFDYAIPPAQLSFGQRVGFELMAARVRAAGEPWRTFFDSKVLADDLGRIGFVSIEDWGPDQINERFFSGRPDSLKVGTLGHLMQALT